MVVVGSGSCMGWCGNVGGGGGGSGSGGGC